MSEYSPLSITSGRCERANVDERAAMRWLALLCCNAEAVQRTGVQILKRVPTRQIAVLAWTAVCIPMLWGVWTAL